MKKICLILLVLIASSVYSSPLYEYRGIFREERKTNSINYLMHLQDPTTIRFVIEHQGRGATDKIVVTALTLSSNPDVSFSDDSGLNKVDVPLPGIYEVTISTLADTAESIRFVLKVFEDEPEFVVPMDEFEEVVATPKQPLKDDSAIDIDSIYTQTVPVDTQKTPVATLTKDQDESPIQQDTIDQLMIETIQSQQAQNIEERTAQLSIELLSPEQGSYINPLTGFVFYGENIHEKTAKQMADMVQIKTKNHQGNYEIIKGSFFSIDKNTYNFLPHEIIPGAVYRIVMTDPEKHATETLIASSFPDIDVSVFEDANSLHLKVSWELNNSLSPDPTAQLFTLQNTKIILLDTTEEFFVFKPSMQPMGVKNSIAYRIRPRQIQLTMPQEIATKIQNLYIRVNAKIDGQDGYSTIYIKRYQTNVFDDYKKLVDTEFEDNDYEVFDTEDGQTFIDYLAEPVLAELNYQKIQIPPEIPANTQFEFYTGFYALENEKDAKLAWPHEIQWDERGLLWVLDTQRRRIMCFTPEGELLRSFGERGDEAGMLNVPIAMAHNNGFVYVSDSAAGSLWMFSEDGEFIKEITSASSASNRYPGSVTFRASEMWTLDRRSDELLCFDLDGNFLGRLDLSSDIKLNKPDILLANKQGLLIIEASGLIKFVNPAGEPISVFQTAAREVSSIGIDNWNGIWIADIGTERILRFDSSGKRLTEINHPDSANWIPTSISIRSDGLVAISDAQSKKIYLFKPVL